MPAANADLRRSLILSVVDKLVIGLLIVLAGFVLNVALERYKTHEAFQMEIAHTRVERIGQVWSALYREELAVDELIETLDSVGNVSYGEAVDNSAATARATKLASRIRANGDEASRLLEENRFWLGERLYTEYRRYYDREAKAMTFCLHVLDTGESTVIEAIADDAERRRAAIRRARGDVVTVMRTVL